MGFIAARCPQCGSNITVDDSRDAGICEFCGTAFVTEKVIQNITTHITNDYSGANIQMNNGTVDNFIQIGINALKGKNLPEAYTYANRALELDAESAAAWELKMRASRGTSTNLRIDELLNYGRNAIAYSTPETKEDMAHTVWLFLAKYALRALEQAAAQTAAVDGLKRQLIADNPASYSQALHNDFDFRSQMLLIVEAALRLRFSMPKEYIGRYADIQNIIVNMGQAYIKYCLAERERLTICKADLSEAEIERRQQRLGSIIKDLPPEAQTAFTGTELLAPKAEGCFIATAVYGSYDCPPVWTLRRFRDMYLRRSRLGRRFIALYYALSPRLIRTWGERQSFLRLGRAVLDPWVAWLNRHGYDGSPYHD